MALVSDKSYRYATEEKQGIGFSENTGADWIFPEGRNGTVEIFDENKQPHTLAFDSRSGQFYDIATRKGPDSSGLTKVWKDKVATNGAGGTEPKPAVTFREDMGTFEHYFIEHKESHISIRPVEESDGLPSDIKFDLQIFADGEPTTAKATTKDIPVDGDIGFDKQFKAHRLSLKVTADKGEHLIVGRQQYYVASNISHGPGLRTMTEMDHQREFALPELWTSVIAAQLIDRATGAVAIASPTTAIGPDLVDDSAITISVITTFGSVTLTGSGTFLVFHKGTLSAVTIGGTTILPLTVHGTFSGWSLSFVGSLGLSGDVKITPTTSADIFDLRIFNTTISTDARGYYFDDIKDNAGKIMIPRV